MVLGKLTVPGRPTNLDNNRACACCACSRCRLGCLDNFVGRLSFVSSFSLSLWETLFLLSIFPPFFLPLWETTRSRLKYFLKEPLSPKQPTNQISLSWGWSGGAMVLGKLPVPGRPTIWITVGQGPTALEVGAGGGGLDIFTLIYPFFPLSPSLWETARYRLKYCLKGPLNTKQPTNQPVRAGKYRLDFIPYLSSY